MKNDNHIGCNVVLNNVRLMFSFFSKKIKNELNKGLQSLFHSRDSITTYKLQRSRTPHNFHIINQNVMIQSFLCINKSREPV